MNYHLKIGLIFSAVLLACSAALATVPAGFTESQFVTGLTNPTAMEFAPDGRLFVCEQAGNLRVIKDDALLPNSFVSVTVNSFGERGLLGVTFDPDFSNNHYIYIYYTATTPTIHNRVSRFTANGDLAVPNSELILLELDDLSSATNHNGGAIHFGADGKLYIAVGENANGANAQSLNNLLGKILRINSDGTIPTNPFDSLTTGKNKAIWAMGLRNPFTFAFQRGTGRMFIDDVGQVSWEEINDGLAGSNYGWPNAEGNTGCSTYTCPLFTYGHGNTSTTGCAITGGDFYNPVSLQFPASYQGDYFFQDLCTHWIRKMETSNNSVSDFAVTTLGNPVDLKVSTNGSLYYLARGPSANTGAVYVIRYVSIPSITINDRSVSEPSSGTAQTFLTVTLSSVSGSDVIVHYDTVDGTAIAPGDYTSVSGGVLTIPSGSISGTIPLQIVGDSVKESGETFFVNLSAPTNATILDSQGKLTINNIQPKVNLNNVTVTEGNSGTTNAVFTASTTFAYNTDVTVNYTTVDGTARAPGDYITTSGALTIPAFSTSATIHVPVVGDSVTEANEAFTVMLSGPMNASLGMKTGTGTIVNDDALPALSMNDVTLVEGNSGTSQAIFTITQSFVTAANTTVKFATGSSTASASKGDFVSKSLTVTIPAGSTSAQVSVVINGDTTYEANEVFFANLSTAVNAVISDAQGTCTLQNDDTPPTASINDLSITEGAANQVVNFTVTLSAVSGTSTSITYVTASGTAIAPSDYNTRTGTLTISPGLLTGSVTVTIKGDAIAEPDENFYMNLTGATNATISDSQGICTILNDD